MPPHRPSYRYWPSYFLRSVREDGGLKVAKKLLTRGRRSAGFDKLVKARRIDLSVEFIAGHDRFRHLFTEQELGVARERLSQLDESAFPTQSSSHGTRTLGEVDDQLDYREGAVERVSVNRFERDPKARAACIRHHGARCKACGLDFEERYGEEARGFIHVHHTRPLSRMRVSNRVDPKSDLVPGVSELPCRLAPPRSTLRHRAAQGDDTISGAVTGRHNHPPPAEPATKSTLAESVAGTMFGGGRNRTS